MRRTLVLALCAAVAAAAVPAVSMTAARDVSAAPRPAASPSPVHWSPCPPDVVQYVPLECATLGVPLDYSKPDGRQIEVAITRVKSKNPAQRRGVLLTNPGGPGISGLDFPGLLAALGLPKSVLDTYDLIGMDPRGIGRSTPVSCGFTAEQERRGLFAKYAHSSADVVRESAYAQKIANQCATSKTASLLPYITTANTARDMDRIREALGEQKISYFGGSYGSYLGAVYTTLFPNQSDRIVIDSVLGPKGYDETAMRQFARGLADRFPDFAKFVVAHPEYRLGTTPLQVKAKFFELARKLRAEPAVNMDETAFRVAAFEALYADASMPQLAKLWQDIDAGNPVAPPQTY
ncbi:alpha/beta fold hydrolase, partial [Kribbella italica]